MTRPDGVTIGLSYGSSNGRLEEVAIPRGSVAYGYRSANESGAGLVETISSPDGVTLTYDYDGPLLLSERTSGYLADTVGLAYDNDLRPVSQTVNGGHTITLRYNLDGLLAGAGIDSLYRRGATGVVDSTALHGLSATSSANLNEYGELKNLHYTWNGGAFHQHLVRDPLGRIATLSETTDSVRVYDYVYTTAGRLKQVKRGSNVLEHYEYDANGNRVAAVRWLAGGADTSTASCDAQDRMTRYRSGKYTYNANGELTRRIVGTDTTKYTYDPLGNLLEVKLPGGMAVTYKVDGRNRRVAKLVDGTFKRGWIYQDGLRVVGELDSTGALAIRYVYGSRSHVPDYLVRYGTTYRLITDQLGSVRQVVDASSGTVAEEIRYDAWGRITSQQSPGFVSVAYAGGLYDQHTGLTRFGARDYDASVGRWTCKDPIGFHSRQSNLYAYAAASPINFVDPQGTDVFIEGPVAGEPAGHVSINVGDPSGQYVSYSFGVYDGLRARVYLDPYVGGDILAIRKTTPEEDQALLNYLNGYYQHDMYGNYILEGTCIGWSWARWRAIVDQGIGTAVAPPKRPVRPGTPSSVPPLNIGSTVGGPKRPSSSRK